MYRAAGYSNVGLRKKTNQDSCIAEVAVTPYGDTALLAVCDGVGGLSSGELASYSVVRWLSDWFEARYPVLLESLHDNTETLLDRTQDEWERGFDSLNAELRKYGRISDTRLGTTCTAALFFNNRFLVGHIGDCRLYRFSEDSSMEILTDDQTWVAREVARGTITPEQARNHAKKNVILQSIGTQDYLQTVFSRGTAAEGDVYMVCCDGFRNELFDDELTEEFGALSNGTEQDIYNACARLADLVMSRNEHDNITAVAMCCAPGADYDLSPQHVSPDTTTAMKPIVVFDGSLSEDEMEKTTDLGSVDDAATPRAATPDPSDAHPDIDAFSEMTIVFDSEGGE